jgi:hypothetical protein
VINTVKWGHPVCSMIVAVQPPDLVFPSAAAVVKTVAGRAGPADRRARHVGGMGACIGSDGVGAEPAGLSQSTWFWSDGLGMWTERDVVRGSCREP